MLKCIRNKLKDNDVPALSELNECFKVIAVEIISSERENYVKDSPVRINLTLESFFPREVLCHRAAVSVEDYKEPKTAEKKLQDKANKTEINLSSNINGKASPAKKASPTSRELIASDDACIKSCRMDELKPPNPLMCPLNMALHLDWKEDKTLDTASVQCNNPKSKLKRTDSSKYRKQSATQRSDYTNCFSVENFLIKPGTNEIILQVVANRSGQFRLGQISLVVENKLEYLSNALSECKLCYEVITQGINIALNNADPKKDLMAGIEHQMELVLTSGSMSLLEVIII